MSSFFLFLSFSIKKNPRDGVNRPEKDMLPRNLRAIFSHKMFIESASSVRTGKIFDSLKDGVRYARSVRDGLEPNFSREAPLLYSVYK